jgi:SAM-dependent methyltransferase
MPDLEVAAPDPRLTALLGGLPEGLFSERFHRSHELADRYVLELALEIARGLDLAGGLAAPVSARELAARRGFAAGFQPALGWLLAWLAAAGWLRASGPADAPRYALDRQLRAGDPGRLRAALLAADPRNAPTVDLLEAAAAAYPRVARGETTGEEELFAPGSTRWAGYFDNANPLYAVNNQLAAAAATRHAIAAGGGALRVLEVGAGAGSATHALLDALAAAGRLAGPATLLVTEPVPFLRRRAERSLRARPGPTPSFAALDIDRDWVAQGAAPGSFDLVYAVNVLHVARDLLFSLRQAWTALRPGGWLVLGECVRPYPGRPVAAELVFQILERFADVSTDPEIRPYHGFLAPEHWRRALDAAGFAPVEIVPDLIRIRDIYPRFSTGALCGQRPT